MSSASSRLARPVGTDGAAGLPRPGSGRNRSSQASSSASGARSQPIDAALRADLTRDEAGLAQHTQVPADGRPGDREALGDLPRPRLARRQELDDLPAHRIGEGGEDEHRHI